MNDLSLIFISATKPPSPYAEASTFVLGRTPGNAWLIGGFLFRTLAHALYGTPKPGNHFDFIVEKRLDALDLPAGWKSRVNQYGNLNLVSPNFTADIIPLDDLHSIADRGLEPDISNFLSGVPLTIQSLAFDLRRERIIGETGINALRTKTVGAHNRQELASYSSRMGMTPEACIREKAEPLGFSPIP